MANHGELGWLWGWFPLWLRKVERRFVLGKGVVKLTLTWSAKERVAG